MTHDRMFRNIVIAFIGGILWGVFFPSTTPTISIISSIFVKCIKMVVTPIIFFSLVAGICSHSRDEKGMRGLFIKTLIYFEIMSLLAIVITFGVMFLLRPGAGLDVAQFQGVDISSYVAKAQGTTLHQFFLNIIPESFLGALAHDNLLSVIFLSVITAIAILKLPNNRRIILFIEECNRLFFHIIKIIITFSPIATFAAIAHSIGQAGLSSLMNLAYLFLAVLLSMAIFCVLVGIIAKIVYGIEVFKLFAHIKQEFLLALATSSTESVFPQMLSKLQSFGSSKKITSFVLPMGYSFNLDGTAIYVTAGALFIQQAYGIQFLASDYLTLFLILLFTSKGAAGVSGAGFITLSATLASIPNNPLPFEGLAILLGIDRFMSDARTITNLIGNALGTLIIAKSENAFHPPQ